MGYCGEYDKIGYCGPIWVSNGPKTQQFDRKGLFRAWIELINSSGERS